jgi:hypothetical protein
MRLRFAIPGDEWEDYFFWLCCFPCALCQETRTLSAAGVEDGTWPAHTGNGPAEKTPLIGGMPAAAAQSGPKQV